MAVYEPVTFHLNINVGDCTILCLKETTVRSPKTLPALHKVVLIDGGYPNWNGGHSAAVIRQFLTVQLPLLFDLEEYPGGVVLIDTVVITHWDYDHYGGIASLLVDDLTPAKDQPAKTQFKHFRYSNAGVPLTWMYVPYMTSSDKQRPPYHIFALSDSTTDRLKFNISVNPGHPQWCENICLLRYGADQVMGVNFFTNVQSPAAVGFPVRPAQLTDGIVPVTLFENPALLINSFTDINDDDPGLFCIACNNFVFQKPTEVEESPPENALEKAANTAFPTLHPHVLIVDVPISSTGGSDSEQTNSASIIAILAWKNTKSDGTRVSHYLAGDALWEQEAAVANWLAPTCKVTNIKLSHHGAALSSPASLFRMLNPVNVIVSAGTSHGHPRWEVLLWLNGWKRERDTKLLNFAPLCYPYYLYVDGGISQPTRSSMVALDPIPDGSISEAAQAIRDYQTMLTAFSEYAPSEGNIGFVAQYQADSATWTSTQKRKYINGVIRSWWASLSNVDPTLSPYGDINKKMHYIRVSSFRADSAELVQNQVRDAIPYPDVGDSLTQKHPQEKPPPNPDFDRMTRKRKLLEQIKDQPLKKQALNVDKSLLEKVGEDETNEEEGDSDDEEEGEGEGESLSAFKRLAVSAVATAAVTPSPPESLPTSGYFICASNEAVVAAANVLSLQPDDPLDSFFRSLHIGYMAFEAVPDAAGVGLLNETGFTDELRDWFVRVLGAHTVTAKREGTASLSALSIEFLDPFPITFGTEAISSAFHWEASTLLPPCGYILTQGSMIFGLNLDPAAPTLQSSLSSMLSFLGLPGDHLLALDITAKLLLDTEPASRNAIWFSPWDNYETVLRLQFSLVDEGVLRSFIKATVSPKLSFSTPKVIVRKRLTWFRNSEGFEYALEPQIIFAVDVARAGGSDIETIFAFEMGVMTIVMRPSDGTLLEFLEWMADLAGADQAEVTSISKWVSSVSQRLPKVLELKIQATAAGLQAFSIVMELGVDFGKTDGQAENAAFLLSYRYSAQAPHHELNGSLWCPVALTSMSRALPLEFDPTFEKLLVPVQPTFTNLSPFLHLTSLFPGASLMNAPAELDLGIFSVDITVTSDGMAFEGVLVRDPTRAPPTLAISLGRIYLGGSYQFSTPASRAAYNVSLSTSINIVGQTPADTATILAAVSHDSASQTWALSGGIEDLKMTTLLQFFPQADSAVMDIMGHLEVKRLGIDYKYGGGGLGTDFLISGSLILDVFQLDMSFERDAAKSWQLLAKLGPASGQGGETTVVQLLSGLFDNPAIAASIPSFANFGISTGGGTGLSVIVTKSTAVNGFITFILQLTLKGVGNTPDLGFDLIQIKSTDASKKQPTKRLVRVSVESIPFKQIPSVPLVGSLKQPFDEVDYVWVHDDAGIGLTRQEVSCVNAIATFRGVKYKDLVAEKDRKPADIILVSGSHFLVTADDSGSASGSAVILDYVFGRPDPPVPNFAVNVALQNRRLAAPPAASPQGDTSMAKLQQSQGPLTIANLGLRYSDNTLSVLFDATVRLGPIEFALLGFGFSLKFTDGVTLQSLSSITPGVSLSGMAIEFNNPPVVIAGIFDDLSTADQIKYLGGVVLGVEPYSFTAVGSYGEIRDKTGHSFKSVFVFCQLEGPLIELEFAEIQGITAGFGYNSFLRYPTVDEVDSFPFISGSYGDPGSDPLALLVNLTETSEPPKPGTGWISSREGPLWLAAGLEVKAFQTLSVQAVVVLEFNPYVSLGIFAKAIAAIPAPPSGALSVKEAFVYAELGIVSSVDFQAGTMSVQAKLSPNSYILDPACHLAGGFALCQWFGASAHAGDWVFTVGGYHPAYIPPSHYPLVDRLSISWDLGGGLSVTGQAYFAITPKVCMGGGYLAAVLTLGSLSAHFRAHADFLINFSPFHFVGDVGVSVGVEFTLDLWICTVHINVDIGAQLHLQGPPFGGYVYVDFWVFGFSIYFGDGGNADAAIDLPAFWQLLLQQPEDTPNIMAAHAVSPVPLEHTSSTSTVAPAIPQINNAHVLVVESGRALGSSKTQSIATKEGAPWIVRPQGFTFRVQSRFAMGTASCNGHSEIVSPTPIYAKPMHLVAGTGNNDQAIRSTLNITVSFEENLGVFTCSPVIKKVPKALWSAYSEDQDPQIGGNSIPGLLQSGDGATVDLMMGVSVVAPPPYISADPIQPFDALAAMSEDVYTEEDNYTPKLPSSLTSSMTEWAPDPLADTKVDLAAPWTAVQKAWDNPVDAAEGYDLATAVVAWAQTLSWFTTPVGKLPTQLVAGIEQYYLSAPFMGQVA